MSGAAAEAGRLLSRLFLPEEYRGEVQVSDIVQASDGLIYAASLGAVIEYDGQTWRSIPVPASWIMDLQPGPDGRVYVAGVDEIGFLEKGPDGRRKFRSILDQVPADVKPLGQLWTVLLHQGAAYWANNSTVLRWDNGTLRTWTFPAGPRRAIHYSGAHVYLASTEEGVLRLQNDEWVVVSKEPPALDLPRAVLDGWASGPMLLASNGRVWRIEGNGAVSEWPSRLAESLAQVPGARILETVRLRDGRLVIISKNAGIFVLNRNGDVDLRFGTEGALTVLNLMGGCEDDEGGLWIGSTNGMVRIELDPSLTVFDHRNGAPPGNMYRLVRHEGVLFTCGEDGLYRFTPGAQGRFERVQSEAKFSPYDLLPHPTGLLIASDRGLFQYVKGTISHVFSGPHSIYTVGRSVTDPARIFVSGTEFVHTLRWEGTAWRDEGAIKAVDDDVRSLLEDEQGVLWMGTPARGIARARRQPGAQDWQSAAVDHFDAQRGLPAGHDWIAVYATPFGPMFTHATGVAVHDPVTDRMIPAAPFTAAGLAGHYTYPISRGNGSTLWAQLGLATAGDKLAMGGVFPVGENRWEWRGLPAAVYSATGYMGASDFFWEPNTGGEGVLWVLGQQSILRCDLDGALRQRRAAAPRVMFRAIARGADDFPLEPAEPPRLSFAREPLRVRFASPAYALPAEVEYQYRLLGYDDRWSQWTAERETTFTNLSGGAYVLEVRARRTGGETGEVTAWRFAVQPPWWRSSPALAVYLLGIVGTGWLGFRWRVSFLMRDRARLEHQVRQRTDELALERDRAEAANRAKTMFLASMSHELRTPLHAILGYSQMLRTDHTLPESARDRLRIVASSGQHLLRLINEVLDLSKIEAGKVELRSEPFDLVGLIREVGQAQAKRASDKGLVFQSPRLDGIPSVVVGDAQKLRQVLDNLLSNAVKFTARGEVRLDVIRLSTGAIRFAVHDTGPGIEPEAAARLFQPFSQTSATAETEERGAGLGLAIGQRLVALMGGELKVDSTVGRGSRFWFEIPLTVAGKDAPERDDERARQVVGYEGPRRQLMIVDDVETNRLLYRDLLAPLGFEVELVGTAEAALSRLEQARPDLLILDLRLPGMDGCALAKMLRQNPRTKDIRILAASASVFGRGSSEALAAGCDSFIQKPFLPHDFVLRVGQLMSLTWREAQQEPTAADELLNPELLEKLLAAARMGDVVALRDAMKHLQVQHPRAAALTEIERAIETLDTDRVVQLVARQLKPPEKGS